MQSKYRFDDKIIKSIILYNKAIAEIKKDNIELAIKDLKKALSYNKGFANATKLLALCYVNNKEYIKAKRLFEKMIKNGIYDDLVKKYLNSLTVNKTNILKKNIIIVISSIIVVLSFNIYYKFISKSQNIFEKSGLIKILVDSSKKTKPNSDKNNLKDGNTILNKDYKDIEKELIKTKYDLNYYKNKYDILLKLNEIEQYCKDREYEKAANSLIKMKNMKLDNEQKIIFDKLWSDIKEKSVWTIYNEGNKLYKKGKYKEALPKLKLAYELGPNLEIMPWITYQIGKCYKETNDHSNAFIFFKKVIDNYPNSKYAVYSQSAIRQIKK